LRPISYRRRRFPPEVIRHAVWLYFQFTLSLRDVEEPLAQRGVEVSYETVQCWTQKFGRLFARNLRRSRPKPTGRWHLDEVVVKICGKRMFLWRAVDDEARSWTCWSRSVATRAQPSAAPEIAEESGRPARGDHYRQAAFVSRRCAGLWSDRSPPARRGT